MELLYRAKDGALFQYEKACIEHDKNIELVEHIKEWCPVTYNDDFNANIMELEDIASYIKNNIHDICAILDKKPSKEGRITL